MKKFLIIFRGDLENEYRANRVADEIRKTRNQVDIVLSLGMKITSKSFIIEDKLLNLNEYDIILFMGNGELQHPLIALASYYSKSVLWPNRDALFYDDKFNEAVFLESIGIPKPKTILLTSMESKVIDKLAQEVSGYPCIIKKTMGSGGEFVDLVNSSTEVLNFLSKMPHPSIRGKRDVILQEYIEESKGTDFRVFCIGEKIIGAIKRTAKNGGFKANVSLGGSIEIVEVPKEIEEYARKIMRESNLLIAGIDFIKSKGGYLVLEINISPGIKGFEEATKINVAKEIVSRLLERVQ